jgi:medium-chain acyl-[acyl-carrier-protein] hydrolase
MHDRGATQTAAGTVDLVAFPCAGGTPALFGEWGELLPDDVKLRPVRLAGRLDRFREPAFTRMEPLVDALANELAPRFEAPFSLFGHSMGSLVAFELARELRRRGNRQLVSLVVASCYAPQLRRRGPDLRDLPADRFVAALLRLNAIPELPENDELLDLTLPALRADIELCETYTCAPEAPLDVPISAFVGSRDPRVARDELEAWSAQTHAEFHMRVLPGDHFFSWRQHDALVDAIVADLRTWHGITAQDVRRTPHYPDDEGRPR